ncbi:hypothetical protein F5Y09DRAFT_344756 [Xylaria sp. FL1042]|nr:hypothetical protein F5Y09DRAFT_344756 [Xylaria sp. FL1042]
MTRHAAPAYHATYKDHDQRCEKSDFRSESWQQSSVPQERLQGSIAQRTPFALSLHGNAYTEPDDLIALLVRERLNYLKVLRFLGFEYQTSVAILRCWITLQLDAAAGGPYDLLGIALAAIAELGEPGEPDTRARHGDAVGCWEAPPRPDWPLIFAQVLNYEALAAIRSVGVYFAPDFTKAKWLVYHMVLRQWQKLVGLGEMM